MAQQQIIINGETAALLQEIWQAPDASWLCFTDMLCEFLHLPSEFPLLHLAVGTASAPRDGIRIQLLAPLPADYPALPEGASWA